MPDDPKPKTLDEAMDAAWKETMGEEAQELPEESQHLTTEPVVEPLKNETPQAPIEEPGTETSQPAGEAEGTESGTETQSAEPPQHWPEADKTMFGTLPDEAKSFLLRRHRDMEADYTRKTQENSDAIKIGKAAIDTIDTEIQTQLVAAGVPAEQFVKNLVGFHKLSMQDPAGFVRAIVHRLNLDPAQVWPANPPATNGGAQPTGQPPSDPVIARIAAIEGHLTRDQAQRQAAVINNARSELQVFAEEKDQQGNALRPHFEKVKQTMGRLMSVDESLDLQQAYEVAVYRDPELRKTIIPSSQVVTAQQPVPLDQDKIRKGEEAARAAKSNRRGSGGGTAAAPTAPRGKMSLEEALNAAADEVGLK